MRSRSADGGVAGVCIHGLENAAGLISAKGSNPFYYITHNPTGQRLSAIVKCYDPPGRNSKERYAWIHKNLPNIAEEAVQIRKAN